MPNFAFIDGQNLHLGITGLGWKLDWRRFRVYLGEHYDVARAYYFVGYIPDRQAIYTRLQDVGYSLVFKAVTYRGDGKPKGNVDAELVLQAMGILRALSATSTSSGSSSGCSVPTGQAALHS